MKAVVFMPLLALALGGFSAHAADSGSHTINLAVGVPDIRANLSPYPLD